MAGRAVADDQQLDALIDDTDRGAFGQDFRSGVPHHPHAQGTAPTLSPATAQFTETAVKTYEESSLAAAGRGAQGRRVAARQPPPKRGRSTQALEVSGDLDANAVGNDIYDSYVEEAVRRFQARHGLTVDGICARRRSSQ